MLQYITENLNLVLMLVFILFYSLLVLLNNNKSAWADFFRNIKGSDSQKFACRWRLGGP